MNILTFDIEEWFHILDNTSTKTEDDWLNYEPRIYTNVERILNLLQRNRLSATFFILGWIAEKYPEIVKNIHQSGHQIGSHTHYHQLIYEQNREDFDNDLKKSIDSIEDITGEKVDSFRAPGFSITEKNKWAFEILYNNGIKHDCSVFPAGRSHGGFPAYKCAKPSILKYCGIRLKEYPINTTSFFGKPWIFSGGGYFRLTPYSMIEKFTNRSDYIMSYFHPRDFDPTQPLVKELSYYRKFKSYYGLKACYSKLERWLQSYKFIDLNYADKEIKWEEMNVVEI